MPGALGRINLNEPMAMEDGISMLSNTDTSAMLSINQMGIHPPGKPNCGAELPDDMTALDDGQLGNLLSQMGQYCGFVGFKLAEAEASRNAAKSLLEFVQARIRLSLRANPVEGNGRLTNPDKNDIVCANPQVVASQKDYDYKQSVYDLIKQVANNAQRNWDTVSRRITQRGQEVDRMRRTENVGNMSSVPMTPGNFRRR